MDDAIRGDLVEIHKRILEPDERPDTLPECTRAVAYECWMKGFLLDDRARTGEQVRIRTFIGRQMSGALCRVCPAYEHGFGMPQRELLSIATEAAESLRRR